MVHDKPLVSIGMPLYTGERFIRQALESLLAQDYERIEELIARKRQIFDWYEQELSGVEGVTLNYEAPETKNSYWMVTVIIDEKFGIEKDRLVELMGRKSIDCCPVFRPLSLLPAYENLEGAQMARQRNRVSYRISPYGINLPCALNMTDEEVGYVCDALKAILRNAKLTA